MSTQADLFSSGALELIWEFEHRLSRSQFRGVPMGSAMAGPLQNEIWSDSGDWSHKGRLKNRIRYVYHHLWHVCNWNRKRIAVGAGAGRVLVTWFDANFRCSELVLPVAKRLGKDRCIFLYATPEVAGELPSGATGFYTERITDYDFWAWWRDYLRMWKVLKPVVRQLVGELGLSPGVYHRMRDCILTCTQWIAGYQELLRRSQVSAVLTEFDRNALWAPLVLSASSLGIPSYTMMHGAPGDRCVGLYPVLADKIFCWGEIFAHMFKTAGVDPSRIEVGGCPRLTRDLPDAPREAKSKIGLDPEKPSVLLAMSNFIWKERIKLIEIFCKAVHDNKTFSSFVRLHPAETLQEYSDFIARYPSIKFVSNEHYTLDTTMAAADIVVTHSSGFGSDALVKRRLTVVLDVMDWPLGHGQLLIDEAGCPRAVSPETLLDILQQLLYDEDKRIKYQQSAEQYVHQFCSYFGDEAAERIAKGVLSGINAGNA